VLAAAGLFVALGLVERREITRALARFRPMAARLRASRP